MPENTDEISDPNLLRRRDILTAAGGVAATGVTPTITTANRTPIADTDSGEDHIDSTQVLKSPNGDVAVTFALVESEPRYSLSYCGEILIEPSPLGFEFRSADPLDGDFELSGVQRRSEDTTWKPIWGETAEVRNHYTELTIGLVEADNPSRSLTLVFRAYNDGAAFRYILPEQDGLNEFAITREKTRFAFADDYTAWWIPDDWEGYEYLYEETPLSEITHSPDAGLEDTDAVNTPITMKTDAEQYLSVHEAALTDYASMTLARYEDQSTEFESALVPWPDGDKVKAETPHASPWRTITVGSDPGDLAESRLILNLNEPTQIQDPSWIDPGKYMGIWWEMHIGKATWAPGPDVGATTADAKRYMDFASEHGIESLLIEGWNIGWKGGFDDWSNAPYTFDFTESTDQYDLEEVIEYGKQKDPSVGVTIHNETGGGISNYLDQIEEAYEYYEELGIHSAKLGYVSPEGMLIDGDRYAQQSQRMVNHYRYVTKLAADHEIMLNIHEPIKPTGVRRTWPNLMTQEGFRGLEYENASPRGNPPAHTLTLPFTRMIAGPVDYNPGIFDITHPPYGGDTRVHNTRARQLALYPILFSGLQMAADLPENYDDLDEFVFIENVPATWDETTVLDSEIGRYATFARRKGDEWFVGSGTDDTPRPLNIPLSFLDNGEYIATVYTDGEDAGYHTNPTAVEIDEFLVDSGDTLLASMIEGGGQAINLRPVDDEETADIPSYEYPNYEYDSFVIQNEMMTSEAITPTLEVMNTGNLIGGELLSLYVDGEETDTEFVRVSGGNEEQVDFNFKPSEPGTYEVGVGTSLNDLVDTETITVVSKSAEFEWLSFEGFEVPEKVEQGTTVEVTGTVTNTGDEETRQVVEMTVGADVVRAVRVNLEPGVSSEVTLEYTFETPGEYAVAIEDGGPWIVTVPEPSAT